MHKRLARLVGMVIALGLGVSLIATDEVTWTDSGTMGGQNVWHGAMRYPHAYDYPPPTDSNAMWYYSTTDVDHSGGDGSLYLSLQYANLTTFDVVNPVGGHTPYTTVLDSSILHTPSVGCPHCDTQTDNHIFGASLVREGSTWYGMLHVGTGSPSSTGTRPAWVSGDLGSLDYYGKITIDGVYAPAMSSTSNAFIARPDVGAVSSGAASKYLDYENGVCFSDNGGYCRKLVMAYSTDHAVWTWYRGGDGKVAELLPTDLPSSDTADYASATLTTGGVIHMLVANSATPSAIRHIISCDGVTFRTIETAAEVFVSGTLGTTIAFFDSSIHAFSNNRHFQYANPDTLHNCGSSGGGGPVGGGGGSGGSSGGGGGPG